MEHFLCIYTHIITFYHYQWSVTNRRFVEEREFIKLVTIEICHIISQQKPIKILGRDCLNPTFATLKKNSTYKHLIWQWTWKILCISYKDRTIIHLLPPNHHEFSFLIAREVVNNNKKSFVCWPSSIALSQIKRQEQQIFKQ